MRSTKRSTAVDWLKSLKSFVHIDARNLKAIKLSLFSGNKDNSLFKLETRDNSKHVHLHLNVNSSELENDKVRAQIQSIVKEATLDDYNQPLLEARAHQRVEDIARVAEETDETLDFFRGKIPDTDMPILRAALYIRSAHKHNHNQSVDNLKQDIVNRFGNRGANIANLCSAGYFESQLRPMYEELAARPDFTPELFTTRYNVIVDTAPFAVFVGRNRNIGALSDEVEDKLLINKQYGIKQMNIHAIGQDNVRRLQELLRQERITKYFTDSPSISLEGPVMNVQIFF
jgi:hypothetical protein